MKATLARAEGLEAHQELNAALPCRTAGTHTTRHDTTANSLSLAHQTVRCEGGGGCQGQ